MNTEQRHHKPSFSVHGVRTSQRLDVLPDTPQRLRRTTPQVQHRHRATQQTHHHHAPLPTRRVAVPPHQSHASTTNPGSHTRKINSPKHPKPEQSARNPPVPNPSTLTRGLTPKRSPKHPFPDPGTGARKKKTSQNGHFFGSTLLCPRFCGPRKIGTESVFSNGTLCALRPP